MACLQLRLSGLCLFGIFVAVANGYFILPGTTNGYLQLNHAIPSLTEFSFSAWIKFNAITQHSTFLSYARNSTFGNMLRLSARDWHTNMQIVVWENGRTLGTVFPPPNNTWSHVAVTWRQSDGDTRLYIDGVEVAQEARSGNVVPGGGCLYIGNDQDEDCDTFVNFNDGAAFAGSIGDAQVFSTVLTPAKVTQLYSRCSVTACSDPTMGESLECTQVQSLCGDVGGCQGDDDWRPEGTATQFLSCNPPQLFRRSAVGQGSRQRGVAMEMDFTGVRSEVVCGAMCSQRREQGCRGFNYDMTSDTCQLVDVADNEATMDHGTNFVHWYK